MGPLRPLKMLYGFLADAASDDPEAMYEFLRSVSQIFVRDKSKQLLAPFTVLHPFLSSAIKILGSRGKKKKPNVMMVLAGDLGSGKSTYATLFALTVRGIMEGDCTLDMSPGNPTSFFLYSRCDESVYDYFEDLVINEKEKFIEAATGRGEPERRDLIVLDEVAVEIFDPGLFFQDRVAYYAIRDLSVTLRDIAPFVIMTVPSAEMLPKTLKLIMNLYAEMYSPPSRPVGRITVMQKLDLRFAGNDPRKGKRWVMLYRGPYLTYPYVSMPDEIYERHTSWRDVVRRRSVEMIKSRGEDRGGDFEPHDFTGDDILEVRRGKPRRGRR